MLVIAMRPGVKEKGPAWQTPHVQQLSVASLSTSKYPVAPACSMSALGKVN